MNKLERLEVKGNQLVTEDGKAIQLRGVSSHGLSWYPQYINKESFAYFQKEWNVNLVRLAMYTAEEDGYCVGDDNNRKKLLELVKNGVKYASELGIYVIVDWHILSDSNPLEHMEFSKEFFAMIAKEFSGYTNVIYEICNEPNVNATWIDIKAYANEIIPIIRKYDEKNVILVGTPTWSQDVNEAVADPVEGFENLMYVLHFYADTHRQELRNKLIDAHDKGLPIFVSEFGICDASGNLANNYDEANNWITLLDERNISFAIWNLSNRDESSAFFVPECDKLVDFVDSDLNDSAKWFINMMKNLSSDEKNYKECFLAGEIDFEEIDDYIHVWNNSDDERTLAKFLGLNEEEEAAWIDEGEDALLELLEKQK